MQVFSALSPPKCADPSLHGTTQGPTVSQLRTITEGRGLLLMTASSYVLQEYIYSMIGQIKPREHRINALDDA